MYVYELLPRTQKNELLYVKRQLRPTTSQRTSQSPRKKTNKRFLLHKSTLVNSMRFRFLIFFFAADSTMFAHCERCPNGVGRCDTTLSHNAQFTSFRINVRPTTCIMHKIGATTATMLYLYCTVSGETITITQDLR